jgi:cytochrome c oxidase subunit 4
LFRLVSSCPVAHGIYYIAYWIAFGAHGPRKETPKGEGWKVFSKVTQLVAVSVALFYSTRFFAGSPPRTMTKEWQEASNEYALVRSLLYISLSIYVYVLTILLQREKMDPITGISSEGYQGEGFVQSAPEKSS